MEEKLYDIRGQICPSTLLIAMKEVNHHQERLKSGELSLIFLIDNRDAITTIPETIGNMGYAVSYTAEKGHYRIVISGAR